MPQRKHLVMGSLKDPLLNGPKISSKNGPIAASMVHQLSGKKINTNDF
jgi:hypothetical protein